ncbi:MAG: hypothetical protein E7525_00005 [Ruminococcaceae bacterium]|nr:hypothetical protein [Oscillospiraceae bacterium]
MKRFLSRTLRSGIALTLTLCLVLGLLPAIVFATESEKKTYVSLGDSMTNGYGMPGYDHNGYLHNVPDTYPELLAETYQWNHIPLAISGMRAEDLEFVLEFPWNDKEALAVAERTPAMDGYSAATHGRNYKELWWNEVHAEKWYETFDSGDFYTWDQSITQPRFDDSYYDVMAQNGKGYGAGVENIARMIQESITEADVISLAVGNANFGVFMRSRVVNALTMMGGNPEANMWLDLERVLARCSAKTKDIVLQIRTETLATVVEAGFSEDSATKLIDAVTYTVASYLISYEKVIKSLMAYNPDAEIIILGLMNTLNGMEVQYNGQLIDLGKCMGAMIDAVNAYLTGLPASLQESGKYANAVFYFASASEVNMWVEEYETVANNWEKYPVIRDRFITKVCDTLFPLVERNSWRPKTIVRADVEKFEAAAKNGNAAFAQYVQQNTDKAASVATYKAFENAIVQTYSMDAPDVTVMMDLENGMNAVIEGVMNTYSANTEQKIQQYWNAVVADVVLPQMKQENATLTDALAYVEQNAKLKADIVELCTVMATPETLTEALIEDQVVCDLLSLLARLEIGDGIGCHPSTEGHALLASAVIEAYGNKNTVADATKNNLAELLTTALLLTVEYGDDIYNYAQENGFFLEATTAKYVPNDNSWYTALGDVTAISTGYVELVANELEIGYTNLASSEQTIDDIYTVIDANNEVISKSDLITIGYGNTGFTHDAVAQMMAALRGQPTKEYDWVSLVGEEGVPYVEQALAEVYASIVNAGMDTSINGVAITDIIMPAIEAYAYGTVSYAVNLPKAVAAIRAINPDAVVIIVGMHNPLSGTVLEQDGEALELGAFIDELVGGANVYGTLLCLATGDAIFVEAPEVETGTSNKTMGVLEFLMAYIKNPGILDPTANGDEYVKNQIINALDTSVIEEDEKENDDEQGKEDQEEKVLLGDVDNNGIVNSRDAMLVSQRYAGLDVEINLSVADVDGNGYINSKDSMQIAQYYAGVITEFPAA